MSFLDELDDLVVKAVNETFGSRERLRQKVQSKKIDKHNFRAPEKNKDEEVVEAEDDIEDDEKEEKPKDIKLTGDPDVAAAKIEKQKADIAKKTPGTPTSKNMHDPTEQELQAPDFQMIAKNINLLRGGKSIKDKVVRRNLKAYIDKLDQVERREVLIYLNSLAQVMSGVSSGAAAPEPDHSSPVTSAEQPKQAQPQKKQEPKKNLNKGSTLPKKRQDVIVVGAS
tara:strand:+ start:253 stop:927 length:675 start_codon:yes stop_codon:yes gene_type:complete